MLTTEPTSLLVPPPADKQSTGVSQSVQPEGRSGSPGHLGKYHLGRRQSHRQQGRCVGRNQSLGGAALLAAVALFVIIGAAHAAAQHPGGQMPSAAPAPAVSPQLAAKLKAPFHLAVTAKPLRDTLTQIAEVAEINFWLDRRVDPSLTVNIPAGSQSVYQAIARAAESLGLQAAAAGNVVLLGRPEWIRALAGAIFALPAELRQDTDWPPINWPPATTPDQAVKIAIAGDGADTLSLPHDLWPAVTWRGVSPQLAVLLITAQFDRMPVEPQRIFELQMDSHEKEPGQEDPAEVSRRLLFSRDPAFSPPADADAAPQPRPLQPRPLQPRPLRSRTVELQPLQAPSSLTLVYPNGPHVPQLRQAALAADPASRFRAGRSGGPLELTGSPLAHIAATTAYVSHANAAASAVELDGTRFSLRLRDAPAQDVFVQLAGTAGRQLQIAPDAAAACQQRVTLEGVNVTLAELTERVAREISVQPTWTEETLLIELAR